MRPAIFLVYIVTLTGLYAQSPLRVRNDLPIEHLVHKIFLSDQEGLHISNISFTGSTDALGAFSNDSKYYLIKRGLILSTGNVMAAVGPNERPDAGLYLGMGGNGMLEEIASGRTYDAAVFSFEFVSDFDSISFNYIFASEEYPEYVDQGVNDIFAFYLEDLGTGVRKNLAVVGKKSREVNVDNINARRNSEFFIANGRWDPQNIMQWASDPGLGELALTYEYDGFTTILTAGDRIEPGRKYRISFAIADVGDGVYDSAVLLEANSFQTAGTEDAIGRPSLEELKEAVGGKLEWKKAPGGHILVLPVNFAFDEDRILADSSLKVLRSISDILMKNGNLRLVISGHTDNLGSEEYNLDLSLRRARFAEDYLKGLGVANAIDTLGEGDGMPVADNVTKRGRLKNRRIEFEFRYQ